MIGSQNQYSCTDPEADVLIKQIWWQHVNIVEKHLQKSKIIKKNHYFNEDRQKENMLNARPIKSKGTNFDSIKNVL